MSVLTVSVDTPVGQLLDQLAADPALVAVVVAPAGAQPDGATALLDELAAALGSGAGRTATGAGGDPGDGPAGIVLGGPVVDTLKWVDASGQVIGTADRNRFAALTGAAVYRRQAVEQAISALPPHARTSATADGLMALLLAQGERVEIRQGSASAGPVIDATAPAAAMASAALRSPG